MFKILNRNTNINLTDEKFSPESDLENQVGNFPFEVKKEILNAHKICKIRFRARNKNQWSA